MRNFFLRVRQDDKQAAITKLKERGVLVLAVAQDDPRLDISFHLVTGDVTDADLEPLAALGANDVYKINLRGAKITDAGLARLKKLTGLERLHLERTAVTDAGLAHLRDLKHLAYLNLFGAGAISDGCVDHVKQLAALKKLFLWQTQVTDAGEAALQEALPEVKIDRGVKVDKQDGKQDDAADKGAGKQDADKQTDDK